MGEMADITLDQLFDACDEEAYQRSDEWVGGWRDRKPRNACRYCQHAPLQWVQVDGQWALAYPNGTLHVCERFSETSVPSDLGCRIA